MKLTNLTTTLFAASSLLLSADALGGKLKVPTDYGTIQAAVDAANPGDVVVIAEGTYFENVVIAMDNLTIRGNGKAIVDGGGGGDIFFVNWGDTVRIEDLVLRNAARGVHANLSHKVVVEDVLVKNTTLTAIWFEQSLNCRVVDSEIRDAGANGIAISESDACHVEETEIERTAANGIYVSGSAHTISDCEIIDAAAYGIRLGEPGVPAESVLVTGTLIEDSANDGMLIGNLSTDCSVFGNVIKGGADKGINVAAGSTGHLIDDNSIRQLAGNGLEIDASDIVVSRNRIKKAGLNGIYVEDEGDGGLYHKNKVKKSALDGIDILGSGNAFHQNKVAKSAGLDLNDHMAIGVNVYAGNSFGTTN